MRRKYKSSLNKYDNNKTDQKKAETIKTIQHLIKHTLNDGKDLIQKEPKFSMISAHQRNTISYKEKEESNFRRYRYLKKDDNYNDKTYNIISYNSRIEKNKNNNTYINNRDNNIEINKSVNLNNESVNYRFKKRKIISNENDISGQKIDKKRTCFYNRRTQNKLNNAHNITDINNVTATKQEKGKEDKTYNRARHRYRYFALSNNLDTENKDNKEYKIHKFIKVNKEIKNNKNDRSNNCHKEGKINNNLLEERNKMKTIESSNRFSLISLNNNKSKANEKIKERNKNENKIESNKIFNLIKKYKRRAPCSNLIDDKISNMLIENKNSINTLDLINNNNNKEEEKENETSKKAYCATEKNDYSDIKSTSNSNSQNKNKSTFNFLIHQAHENSSLSNTFNKMYESYKIHKKIKYDGLTRKKTFNCLNSVDHDNSKKYPSHLSLNSSSFNSISFLIKEYGSDKGKKNEFKHFNNERSQKKFNVREKLKNFLEISPKSEDIINDNVDSVKNMDSLSKNESINVTNKIVNNNTFNTTYNIYKINEPLDKKGIYCKPKQKTFKFSELVKERPINQSMQRLKYYNMIANNNETKTSEKKGIYDSNSHKRIDSFLSKTPKKYQEIIINFNKIDNNNSINFEHIYSLESKNKSILNKINNYDICFNECHDWIEYYFNKNIYDIIISFFKIKRNKNNIINKIKIETLCYFLCYDASFSKNFSQAGILIKTIFNLLHNNFLLLIGFIINNFTSKNNNNDQYNNQLIKNLNNLISKELKINLSSQDMNNENCIIDIIEQNYKQINNYYKMIIDNIYNYNFTPSMSSSPVNDINAMNYNNMYKFPHCLSLNLDKLNNNQKLKIISLFFFDAYKLLNNYNILDLKVFYDLYLNKKTIDSNSIKYNDNIKQNYNSQRNKNKIGYHIILSNNFINDSKHLLSPIKSYYKYTLMVNLDTIVYADEIMHYYNINFNKAKEKIILRPGLIKFLQEMKQIYELILFCNNSLEYIKKALRHFETNENIFEHILCCNQLCFDKDGTIKDLDLLGRNLKHIIIIDSNPNKFKSNKDNVICIRPFYGNVSDDGNVLKELTEILKVIRYDIEDFDDVRISLYNHKLEIFTKISNYLF